MKSVKDHIHAFFKAYEDQFNQYIGKEVVDPEKVALFFSDCFIEASPLGVNCGKNDEKFRGMIPKGYEFYKNIGITDMNIRDKYITLIDEFHAMVKVNWVSKFVRKDGSPREIIFDVFYLLQTIRDKVKIFAYITGDEQEALRKEGLI